MRKILIALLRFPSNVANWIALKRKGVAYGTKLQINGKIRLHGNGKIQFGNGVTIHSSGDANPAGGEGCTHLTVGNQGTLVIDDCCGLSNCAITAMKSVVIEKYVLIGTGTMIADTDFHSAVFEERVTGDDSSAKIAPVRICEGAFIGARCIILKGVTIGKKAVVGAGSVVTKSIPDGEIWAGNPAKPIRK